MKEDFKKDIQKLEEFFLPNNEAIVSKIPDQKAAFKKNSQNYINIATKGEEWHKEIDDIIKKLTSDIDGMASRQNTVLNKGEDDYACIIS